ncbi:Electron transport complex subunit RsxD [bioreactor metagenome]|uniref:Electron transport complex subunit RsxD n=1 Tax=bioreactor metagenome TaxID=1076179 RepID=A0A645CNE5_9ZZZZ
MEHNHSLTAAPHVRGPVRTGDLMNDVTIALLPATLFAVYNFGLYAAALLLTAVFFALATEYFFCWLAGRPIVLRDGSALVTGLLIGLNMPPAAPLWLPILGSVLAVGIFKQLFGGLGRNIINPAIGARVVLLLAFTAQMSAFGVDAYTGATPLMALRRTGTVDLARMIVGLHSGSLGEVSALALLAGGIYLLVRRVIRWQIPVIYMGSFLLFMAVFGGQGADPTFLLAHLLGGGLLLGAFFMATDYVTGPVTNWGMVIYAVLVGVLTGYFRVFTHYPEGVSFAILIANFTARFLDRLTLPAAFGCGKRPNLS